MAEPQRIYEAIIKVNVADPAGKRARDIADGIGYACALLMDEYGFDCDAIVGLLEQTMNEVEDVFDRRGADGG